LIVSPPIISQLCLLRHVLTTAQFLYVVRHVSFVSIVAALLVDSHTLESLSDISGGLTLYVPKQDAIAPVLEEVRRELGRQYYIAYYVPRRAGFHHIRIEVPGRDVKIRAKTGYSGG